MQRWPTAAGSPGTRAKAAAQSIDPSLSPYTGYRASLVFAGWPRRKRWPGPNYNARNLDHNGNLACIYNRTPEFALDVQQVVLQYFTVWPSGFRVTPSTDGASLSGGRPKTGPCSSSASRRTTDRANHRWRSFVYYSGTSVPHCRQVMNDGEQLQGHPFHCCPETASEGA